MPDLVEQPNESVHASAKYLQLRESLWKEPHRISAASLHHLDVFDAQAVDRSARFIAKSIEKGFFSKNISSTDVAVYFDAYAQIFTYAFDSYRTQALLWRLKARYAARTGQTLRGEFDSLAEKWRNETGHLSSVSAITSHRSYLKIIAMGLPAVPLILAELRKSEDTWYPALSAITGENPIRPEHRGNTEKMRRAWLKWGESRGYGGE